MHHNSIRRWRSVLVALGLAVAVTTGTVAVAPGSAMASVSNTRADAWGTLELAGNAWLGGAGVDVYSNGATSTGPSPDTYNYVGGVQSGIEWQCVELISRLYLSRGWTTSTWYGDGNRLYANAPAGLTKQPNGSISYLNPGDVITLDGGGSGHAGVINSVSGSTVQIVNQNTAAVYSTATWTGGSITMTGWAGYTVQGVIHAPTSGFSPGIVRPAGAGWEWDLRNSNSGGPGDSPFTYGIHATDHPMPGDWDGNDSTTPGVVRADGSHWHWYIRNSNSSGGSGADFTYGLVTDTPVVGDWDGNGTVTPGVVRRNGAGWQWYLRNDNSGGSADVPVFAFGVYATDTPIVGDWNGDHSTTIGVYRKDGAGWHWYLRNANSAGAAFTDFIYGLSASDAPIVGDWDGDHDSTPGVIRQDGAGWHWYLRDSNSGGAADDDFIYGLTMSDTPVVGNWDGQ